MAIYENGAFVFLFLQGGYAPVGYVLFTEDERNVLQTRFQYAADYLQRPDAVALDPLALPLTRGEEIVATDPESSLFPIFLDLVPDNWRQRILGELAHERKVDVSYFNLMTSGDRDAIGAVAFGRTAAHPDYDFPLQPAPGASEAIDLDELATAVETYSEDGYKKLPKRLRRLITTTSSVGGSRPKSLVYHDGAPAIAKFKAPLDAWNMCRVEYATMTMAKRLGLRVPPMHLIELNNRDVFIIERFDRSAQNTPRHMISAAVALGVGQGIRKLGENSYMELAEFIAVHGVGAHVQEDRKELFKRMVFNMFTRNEDDHLRNHSFVLEGSQYRLSPLYDVVPGQRGVRSLYLAIGEDGGMISRDNALSHCAAFGLTRHDAETLFDAMAAQFAVEWETFFRDCGVPERDMDILSDVFAMTRFV